MQIPTKVLTLTLCLAVVELQPKYRLSGFEFAYTNIRWGGTPIIDAFSDSRAKNRHIRIVNHMKEDSELAADIQASDTQVDTSSIITGLRKAVYIYDRNFFPAPRISFLAVWLEQQGHELRVALNDNVDYSADDCTLLEPKVVGYGVMRRCGYGFKIGPLFADNDTIATKLLDSLLTSIPAGQVLFIDVPDHNTAATRMALEIGLKKSFETARMYRYPHHGKEGRSSEAASISLVEARDVAAGVFGVTTFELG
jgi:hypothetical protein